MKDEHRLILDVSLIRKKKNEKDNISNLLNKKLDWAQIAGQLINHRISGYFYKGLSGEQINKLPKELRSMLKLINKSQKQQFESRLKELKNVSNMLNQEDISHAMLKGIVYCMDFYSAGARRSNDIDIMVREQDLGKLDKGLRNIGYIQSLLPGGKLVEASKKEKLIQLMNYHDLVPYVKMLDNELIELDINFKFDSKDNLIDDDIFEYGIKTYSKYGYEIKGLPFYTHLLFLCIHFYREATNTLWTNGKRDMILYKVVDIVNLIRAYKDEFNVDECCEFARKCNLEDKCFYTFYTLNQFYSDEPLFTQVMEALQPQDKSFIDNIFVEGENRIIKRERSFIENAFDWIM